MTLSCRGNRAGQPLPRCVNSVSPASQAAASASRDGSQWPAATVTPAPAKSRVTAKPGSRSGASVTNRTSPPPASSSRRITSPSVGRAYSAGWAPM